MIFAIFWSIILAIQPITGLFLKLTIFLNSMVSLDLQEAICPDLRFHQPAPDFTLRNPELTVSRPVKLISQISEVSSIFGRQVSLRLPLLNLLI